VYDILNAGPHHRFTCSNVLVSNCYGMGPGLLASTLGMSLEQAKHEVFEVYHERVSFVKETYDRAAQKAASRGYVKTILGRRAHFPLWQNASYGEEVIGLPEAAAREKWKQIKRAFTHKALNRVLQGSAADLMKKAMYDIWRSGVYQHIPVAMLTVHDELDHSRPNTKAAERAVQEVKHLMEVAIPLKIPVIAEEERGPSWGECKTT
jgi:DNA polymerase I-like protein with 3'-5' exonuclease and polymerase domains